MKTELRHMSQSLFFGIVTAGVWVRVAALWRWQHWEKREQAERGDAWPERRPACACLLCHSLLKLCKARPDQRWVGAAGRDSRKYRICGEAGAELTIPVPTGTTVWLEQHQKLLGTHCEAGTEAVGRCGSGGLP
ncbi:uncharacterized protein LOC135097438 isoform X2 [Scylla paramamosain]|uniref:uncharacterized protein LOC135097438 isoform X2 n=1 Tax=Scylla paramamosain TaxID=85552 RepID=UPI003083C62E